MTYAPPSQRVADGSLKAIGYQQITGLSSVKSLTVPDGALSAMVSIESKDVRYRNDGTAPSSSVGMPLSAGSILFFCEDLSRLQFIEQSASAIVNVTYYI